MTSAGTPTRVKKRKKLSDKQKLREFFAARLGDKRTGAPACRHFGVCGGCEFQDVPYAEQLSAKRDALAFIAREVAAGMETGGEALTQALSNVDVPVVESPKRLGYRQRMDYVYTYGGAGLRMANRHRRAVELEECPLLGGDAFAAFQKARRLADAAGLERYDHIRHTGYLRYFVVRRNRRGGVLLSLVTKTREHAGAVVRILEKLVEDGDVESGHWLLAEGLGDVSFGEPLAHAGKPFIVEEMNGVRLAVGPNTFFQANPAVAERAYAAIRDFCPPGGTALDMYSGVGSIALTLSRAAGRVTAVENVPENVELARTNIAENAAANVDLILEDSAKYLSDLIEKPGAAIPDLAVVNPPRAGVENGGMAALKRLGAGRLAYLSCNPFTLLRNLAEVLDLYRLRSLTLYDMFPQTRHFESLALLERI